MERSRPRPARANPLSSSILASVFRRRLGDALNACLALNLKDPFCSNDSHTPFDTSHPSECKCLAASQRRQISSRHETSCQRLFPSLRPAFHRLRAPFFRCESKQNLTSRESGRSDLAVGFLMLRFQILGRKFRVLRVAPMLDLPWLANARDLTSGEGIRFSARLQHQSQPAYDSALDVRLSFGSIDAVDLILLQMRASSTKYPPQSGWPAESLVMSRSTKGSMQFRSQPFDATPSRSLREMIVASWNAPLGCQRSQLPLVLHYCSCPESQGTFHTMQNHT
ncbi:hypothetical protein K456DRAFT_1366288 [Colletotrichum gloeosporioides 23]|nr:hypothetical protein K456DRAFT_1366288 [Colletotrichum gloeosporioides 23]